MKWLVIYFYLSGGWIAGDFVHPEGWSSIQYATKIECIEHMGYANENLQKSDQFQDNAKAVCLSHKPDLFTPAPKF